MYPAFSMLLIKFSQPVEELGIPLGHRDPDGLVGQGSNHGYQAGSLVAVGRHNADGKVGDHAVGLPVDHHLDTLVLGADGHQFCLGRACPGDGFAGRTLQGHKREFRTVDIRKILGLSEGGVFREESLPGGKIGSHEGHFQVAARGHGHVRDDHVDAPGFQGRQESGKRDLLHVQLDAHGVRHHRRKIRIQADDLVLLVEHVQRRHVPGHADLQFTPRQDAVQDRRGTGGGSGGGRRRPVHLGAS